MSALMHRWFVQYNPLYFASALFVLAGVVLLTRDPVEWSHGQLALAGLIQLYELALIGGAALLFNRPGQRRPAVILGVVALAFAFDITFRTEALASLGDNLLRISVLWGALFAIKLGLIARALRVRLPRLHAAAWTLAGLMLAVSPHLIGDAVMDRRVVITAACWLGIGLVALAVWARPGAVLPATLHDWGRIVAGRITALVPLAWTVFYWVHVVAWCGIYELRFTPMCFLPAIAFVPFLARTEIGAWLAAALALALAYAAPAYFGAIAVFLALGLAAKAYRHRMPRLYVAGAVVLAVPVALPWLPARAGQWGAVLVASGFATLGAGVALNWWSGRTARSAPISGVPALPRA